MIVLGLHGWEGTHDAAAALVVDGKLVACMEEERLNRRKHALSDSPKLAARAVLAHAGLSWEDIDAVSYGWNLPEYCRTYRTGWNYGSNSDFLSHALGVSPRRWPTLHWTDHHLAHAASAFYASGFDRAAVIVVDGQGEKSSISLFSADRMSVRLLRDWPPSCSLGLMYEAATLHCGFRFLDAGKTMGLAAYAPKPENPLPLYWDNDNILTPVHPEFKEDDVVRFWARALADRFGSPVSRDAAKDSYIGSGGQFRDDLLSRQPEVAAAAQDAVERVLVGLVNYAQRCIGTSNVVLTGGVALNCVANGRVRTSTSQFFVPPYAHDAGAAVGAALLSALAAGDTIESVPAPDLGCEYSTTEMERALLGCQAPSRFTDDPAAEAARLLLDGQVIGWFQGRSEVGPRALGRRSILALPSVAANAARVNRIKGREGWRPLAPSALGQEAPWMFGHPVESPYMLISLALTQDARQQMPAVSHVDGSSRVQTVPSSSNDSFSRLLRYLSEETGHAVVLNTSFNAAFEPIVDSPDNAISTFTVMELDALIIGHHVIEKR